jgi:hypothetical protein
LTLDAAPCPVAALSSVFIRQVPTLRDVENERLPGGSAAANPTVIHPFGVWPIPHAVAQFYYYQ